MNQHKSKNPEKTVDEYLAEQPLEIKTALENLRNTIKEAAPEAMEVISYQIPTYKLNGPLVHFQAAKNHCSFITVSRSVLEKFKPDLENYKTSGTTIQFTTAKPLPQELVKRIVKARIEENNQ